MIKRKLIRLQNYNYSENGYYFVTICTCSGKSYFNNSDIRVAAEKFWLGITEHNANVHLDSHVIMPNHMHGIIIIANDAGARRDTPWRVPTKKDCSRRFGGLTKHSLSSVINQFKGSVTRWCNNNRLSYFKWQARFYEHVIRNEHELTNIREYIINNPLRWNLDAENPENRKYGKNINITDYYRNIFEINADE